MRTFRKMSSTKIDYNATARSVHLCINYNVEVEGRGKMGEGGKRRRGGRGEWACQYGEALVKTLL